MAAARAIPFVAAVVLASCGYHLARTDRTVHVALSSEGTSHPDAVPALQGALAAALRDAGVRIGSDGEFEELSVVLLESSETAAMPAGTIDEGFQSTSWDVRLGASATLLLPDGTLVDLGTFEAGALEAAGPTALTDDAAQGTAVDLAARSLADRIAAAVIAAR